MELLKPLGGVEGAGVTADGKGFSAEDIGWMRLALELAEKGRGRTSPNPMVGAVLVRHGQLVGRGYHERAGKPHAEAVALRDAGNLASEATLYVTLEPCTHHGRTPPCVEAIISSGIVRVVAPTRDPNPVVCGRGFARLVQAGISLDVGVCEEEARRLNEAFITYVTKKRPFVLLKSALSLDGKTATRTGDSRWITGPAARAMVHKLRSEYDAVMVGINTVLADNPRLTARSVQEDGVEELAPKQPVKVVVDTLGRLPLDSAVLEAEPPAAILVAVTGRAPAGKVSQLRERGAQVLTLPEDEKGRVQLDALMSVLADRDIVSVMSEGGGTLNASLISAGLADKLLFFVAPVVIGGTAAPGPVGGHGVARVADVARFRLARVWQVGDDAAIEAYPECGADSSSCVKR
ncbi:MAG: bifunctional diaminohydroxyphosphoribosylaminopyrimidine deaminase/5-amino-6-(5-phosphoribosylamino)uracil reductase RibD [Firmicutes bacterium]|nr:bifunctional diaminohydroxyphosphoribosylaminopyrimidine deaminase/5-amino-6-(5-phosphoribosylamino)uracil reductase RibD [Bacillota bacterium]